MTTLQHQTGTIMQTSPTTPRQLQHLECLTSFPAPFTVFHHFLTLVKLKVMESWVEAQERGYSTLILFFCVFPMCKLNHVSVVVQLCITFICTIWVKLTRLVDVNGASVLLEVKSFYMCMVSHFTLYAFTVIGLGILTFSHLLLICLQYLPHYDSDHSDYALMIRDRPPTTYFWQREPTILKVLLMIDQLSCTRSLQSCDHTILCM